MEIEFNYKYSHTTEDGWNVYVPKNGRGKPYMSRSAVELPDGGVRYLHEMSIEEREEFGKRLWRRWVELCLETQRQKTGIEMRLVDS